MAPHTALDWGERVAQHPRVLTGPAFLFFLLPSQSYKFGSGYRASAADSKPSYPDTRGRKAQRLPSQADTQQEKCASEAMQQTQAAEVGERTVGSTETRTVCSSCSVPCKCP